MAALITCGRFLRERESLMSEDEIRLIIDPDFLSRCCLEKKKTGYKACSQSGERGRVMEEWGS